MIHIACKDKAASEQGDLSHADELIYVAESFRLAKNQVHESPPAGLPVIVIQPTDGTYIQGKESLVDFEHPDDCVYLFGASHGHLEPDGIVPEKSVFIPHVETWNLFASQAAAIVLYDRYVKRGGFG